MNMIKNLGVRLSRRLEVSDKLIKTFGVFGIISFPLFYFVNTIILGKAHELPFLRLSGFILSVPLVLIGYWPTSLSRYRLYYWYFTLFYCLPLYGTYMFIDNIGSNIWYAKAIIGVFWLLLITDWLIFIVILPAGILAGWAAYHIVNGPTHFDITIMTELIINYIWAVLMGAALSRGKDNINQEKLVAMKALAGTVAHEMRTPFLGIRSNIGVIKKYLPSLIDAYQKAKLAKIDLQSISEKNIQHLKDTPEDLEKITSSASLAIDMLLTSLKDDPTRTESNKACSINACIQEMLHEYPLLKEEKSLILYKEKLDFTFHGNSVLLKHVLFNLLKNALYYIKAAHKGTISIWTESSSKVNFLYFKDTGTGIPASEVSSIFDRFYSNTRHGTGLGLSFCKTVMESFGGSIACESKEGEHTTFILKFPVAQKM